jgi:hypothetical protein
MGGKELGGAVNRATSKLTKGIAQGRKVKNAYIAARYGEIRKSAEALQGARNKQAQSLMARETAKRKTAAASEMESAQINKGFRELSAQRASEKRAGEEEHMFEKAPVTMPSKAQQLKAGGGPRRAGAPVSSAQMRGPAASTSSTGLS